MKTLHTAGIIIQSTAVRESDSMLALLSRDAGRISVLARTARRSQKRFMGGLDLFDCGKFDLRAARSAGGPWNLEQITQREQWPALRADLDKFSVASYCLDLTLQFAQEGEPDSAQLFTPLFRSLRALDTAATKDHATLLGIYYNLLVLQLGGFNVVDDIVRFRGDEQLHRWFSEMLSGSAPILPFEPSLLRKGFHTVAAFSQEILGKELRSRSSVRA